MSAIAADETYAVHYGRGRAWIPMSEWHPRSTRVAGIAQDGAHGDVATVLDPAHSHRQRPARDAWLHGRVLVVESAEAPPVLVLPLEELTGPAVGMALRTWLLGQAVATP